MSIKNKTKDRNSKGKIKRKYTAKRKWPSFNGAPSWWVTIFMIRPQRRKTKKICHDIIRGKDFDDIPLPLGNCKPHEYYW